MNQMKKLIVGLITKNQRMGLIITQVKTERKIGNLKILLLLKPKNKMKVKKNTKLIKQDSKARAYTK
jgi:hypothetical protein